MDRKKDRSGPQEATAQTPHAEPEAHGYGQYLFGASYTDPNAPQGMEAPANWSSYTTSRILVRLFSRGLMGATFYTLAHRWIPGQLQGYQAEGAFNTAKPLQWLARGFDLAYGKPIQAYVRGYYRLAGRTSEEAAALAKEATEFRPRRNFGTEDNPIWGRSLGAEIVGMSTDFAAGSTGDAWGRQIANMFDPYFKNSWEREDGTNDWNQFAKAVGKSAWKIFSKNQGEDWAVALPYVYQMRFQRQAIDKLYRGFGKSSDHQFNGGSWRMNSQGDIVGSYAKAGALDLQARFTGYNWYTLMYRDLYDRIEGAIQHYREDGEWPDLTPHTGASARGLLDSAAQLVRYTIKSGIKAGLYMTPAVPFFWVTRTPQTKAHGMGIEVDEHTGEVAPGLRPTPADPFAREHTRGVLDRTLNPFGKACYNVSKTVNRIARALGAPESSTRMGYGFHSPKTFAEDWVNSSASYTPYMIAKAETALRWDRPKDKEGLNEMDRAIYRFLDGIACLNLGEVSAGFSDMREEIIRPPSNQAIEQKVRAQESRDTLASADVRPEAVSEGPGSKVREVQPQTREHAASAAMPAQEANWQHKALREQFLQEPLPAAGATIH